MRCAWSGAHRARGELALGSLLWGGIFVALIATAFVMVAIYYFIAGCTPVVGGARAAGILGIELAPR